MRHRGRDLELATVVCNRGIPRVLGILSSLLSLRQLLLQLCHLHFEGELLLQCLALLQEKQLDQRLSRRSRQSKNQILIM